MPCPRPVQGLCVPYQCFLPVPCVNAVEVCICAVQAEESFGSDCSDNEDRVVLKATRSVSSMSDSLTLSVVPPRNARMASVCVTVEDGGVQINCPSCQKSFNEVFVPWCDVCCVPSLVNPLIFLIQLNLCVHCTGTWGRKARAGAKGAGPGSGPLGGGGMKKGGGGRGHISHIQIYNNK